MTVECTYRPEEEGRWTGEVLGYCDVDHLDQKRDIPVSSIADDLKG